MRASRRRDITPRRSSPPVPVPVAPPRAAPPRPVPSPRITAPGAVVVPPRMPAERAPVARTRRRLSLPGGVRSGTFQEGGRTRSGYIISPSAGRGRRGTGSRDVEIPFTFRVEGLGNVRVMLSMTLSQLRAGTRSATMAELTRLIRETIAYHAQQAGRRVESTTISHAMRNFQSERGFQAAIRRLGEILPEEDRRYLESR